MFSGFWSQYYHAIKALFPFNYDAFVEHTAKIFPRMAKCEFYNYGVSGSSQKFDALCLLPLNILNEKIFAFLFFWLILMFCVTAVSVMWSLVVGTFTSVRLMILKAQSSSKVTFAQLRQATNNGAMGDFFVLHLLGKNVNEYVFDDLLVELSHYDSSKKFDEDKEENEKKDIP